MADTQYSIVHHAKDAIAKYTKRCTPHEYHISTHAVYVIGIGTQSLAHNVAAACQNWIPRYQWFPIRRKQRFSQKLLP